MSDFHQGLCHGQETPLSGVVAANTAVDVRNKSTVEFQFTAGTVSVTRSLDNQSFAAYPVFQSDGTLVPTATTPGIYSTNGGGWLMFSAPVVMRAVSA